MNLSDRKKSILKIVVDDYIATATPISSKQIQEKHLTELSSAPIRNELSALEDMGYLMQPHPSAGRVPMNKAYKIYVNELMRRENLSNDEVNYISTYFDKQIIKIEDLVKSAARLISDMTNYTSVVIPHGAQDEYVTDIRLIKITEKQSLLVIVIDNDIVRDSLLTTSNDMDETTVENATMILCRMFKNKSISKLILDEEKLGIEFSKFKYLFKSIIDVLREYVNNKENDIVLEGQSKILQYPEYNDLGKAKQFFEIMDSKKFLLSMLGDKGKDENVEVTVNIGNEKDENGLPTDCSIVTANYKIGGKDVGSAGVIGPSRMKYGKVVSVLDSVGAALNEIAIEHDKNKLT